MNIENFNMAAKGTKVDHPLAKYNSKGDLYCLLCNNLIKNANAWKVHLSTKAHKDCLLLFKAGKSSSGNTLKRTPTKSNSAPPRSLKRIKTGSSSFDKPFSDKLSNNQIIPAPVKHGILKQSSKVVPKLPAGFVPRSKHNDVNYRNIKTDTKILEETNSSLPIGFFDEEIAAEIKIPIKDENLELPDAEPSDVEPPDKHSDSTNTTKSDLPEGFFDDAREDAKARKIEYKDPQESEWEKFQNEMEQEDIRYNTILEEDDQKLREERDVDIGIEQKLWDYRVESIASSAETGDICAADKQAFVIKLGISNKAEKFEEQIKDEELLNEQVDIKMEEDSSDEYDDLMDWRTKKAL